MELGGKLAAPLPFEESFWHYSHRAQAPVDISGFICQLPTRWTYGENNSSGINITILASNQGEYRDAENRHVVFANDQSSTEDPITS